MKWRGSLGSLVAPDRKLPKSWGWVTSIRERGLLPKNPPGAPLHCSSLQEQYCQIELNSLENVIDVCYKNIANS